MLASALEKAYEIDDAEQLAKEGEANPEDADGKQVDYGNDGPKSHCHQLGYPEHGDIEGVRDTSWIPGLKDPLLLAIFGDLTPPPEPHQLPRRQILDHPEIEAQQQYSDHEGGQIAVSQQFQHQVPELINESYSTMATILKMHVSTLFTTSKSSYVLFMGSGYYFCSSS